MVTVAGVVSVAPGAAPIMRQDKTATPLVTFIIPTKGRDTLNRTLASLFNLTQQQNWRAIIVADGVDVSAAADTRVMVAKIPRTGASNHGALLRNFGLMRADTEWVGYVDDDDTLAPTYIQRLQEELQLTPSAEAVIFRMLTNSSSDSLRVLPLPHHTDFKAGYVGISFAMKRQMYLQGFLFVPGSYEDFRMLDTLRLHKKKMVMSKHVTYFVKSSPVPGLFANVTARAIIN